MILAQAENFIADYAGSEHFLFLNTKVKESAEPLLTAFFQKAQEAGVDSLESLKTRTIEEVLMGHMPRLELPVETKRAVPDLLEGFFGFLKETGRFPSAGAWGMCVETLASKYRDSIREDGTQRGTTFKKKYTDVGRNDPCPCGSGQKFKKCCMSLLG